MFAGAVHGSVVVFALVAVVGLVLGALQLELRSPDIYWSRSAGCTANDKTAAEHAGGGRAVVGGRFQGRDQTHPRGSKSVEA